MKFMEATGVAGHAGAAGVGRGGEMFTCAVTWHGALYTWGSGARGQLGTGSLQDRWGRHWGAVTGGWAEAPGDPGSPWEVIGWEIQVVRMPSGRLVKSIACGREHCIVVTYDGNAYAWGKGDKAGTCCRSAGWKAEGFTPEAENGAAERRSAEWMWGSTELGKLGLGKAQLSSSDTIPVAIRAFGKSDNPYKAPAQGCVLSTWGRVSGGLSYEKGVLNDNGELAGDLWVWGRNRCIGEHEHAKAGHLGRQGLVYAWGDNRNGQIGLEGGKKDLLALGEFRSLQSAMFAWGNQSCGRLGLQEKKMEKAQLRGRPSLRGS
eukprot:Skav217424  [mRNA]  locus=scaffold1729:24412:31718:+ [translate_table: standard]